MISLASGFLTGANGICMAGMMSSRQVKCLKLEGLKLTAFMMYLSLYVYYLHL